MRGCLTTEMSVTKVAFGDLIHTQKNITNIASKGIFF